MEESKKKKLLENLIYKDECYKIIGAYFEVYYLNASGFELGLLVNFGHHPKIEYERIVRSVRREQPPPPTEFSL